VLVSVVVPVYNVEDYLGECLDSILAQTHPRLDVVVVDDGSPDGSIDIARRYAAQDRRIRIVQQANGGLGAARNTGVRHARGQMLCFVDSDDTLPPGAIEAMLRSLRVSGSDFAVGSLVRDTVDGQQMPPWAKKLHATTRRGLVFADEPDVLKNVFAWTKLYRTEFFRRVVKEFPDGIYEDQAPAARAYLHGTFDILDDVVCHWRIRDDGTSITQQKSTMKDLVGRWGMLDELAEEMRDAPAELLRAWQVKTIGFDMRPYYEQVPRTPSEYWDFLRERVRHFLDESGYEILTDVPVSDRLFAAATYHGYRADLATLLERRESQTWKVPGRIIAGRPEVHPDYFGDLDLEPDDVISSLELDAEVRTRTDTVTISDGVVELHGSAHLAQVTVDDGSDVRLRVFALDRNGGRIEADVAPKPDPAIDSFAKDPWNDHAQSGFVATVDLSAAEDRSFTFEVEVTVDGFSRSGVLARPGSRGPGRAPVFDRLDADGRWCMDRQNLALVVRRLTTNRVAVRGASMDGTTLVLDVEDLRAERADLVATSQGRSTTARVTREPGRTTARFDLRAWLDTPQSWTFSAAGPRGEGARRLSWAASSCEPGPGRGAVGRLTATQFGNLTLDSGPLVGEVDQIRVHDAGVEIVGWMTSTSDEPVRCRLTGTGSRTSAVEVTGGDHGEFRVVVPLVDEHGVNLPPGQPHEVTLECASTPGVVRIGAELWSSLQIELLRRDVRVEPIALPSGAPGVVLRPPFSDDARGRRRQRLLQDSYREAAGPLRDAVLFEVFNGRSVGDSPLALSRELYRTSPGLDQYWSVADLRVPVPPWATAVLRYSADWYDALAHCRLLVNNNNWPWYFTKRPGQKYVQTWHGTPLKKIGNHVPDANLSITYRRLMEREAASWDLLLAQNDYSAQIFPEAFGYDGDVLVTGYPRNDSLLDGTATTTRREMRDRLGIGDDDRVLLYAPTWRDNLRSATSYGRVSYLDAEQLPRGTVVLYRGHANTASATSSLPDSVIDVTSHPDVNELMLAADVLVTDYSSIMFDFAVLRRPIYFLVPDLDLYAGTTRGFYRDLRRIAPGPLCASTSELVDALASDYWAAHGSDYDAFVAEFAPHDDGRAAERVVERLTARQEP